MSHLCLRCTLRLRNAQSSTPTVTRSFSATPNKRRTALPKFTPTSQPQLDAVLASMRDYHFLPASLNVQQRSLIFKQKYKQQLADTPEVITIAGEQVTLRHIDRRPGKDVRNMKKDLLPKSVELMGKGEKSDWNNLPALLTALKRAKFSRQRVPSSKTMAEMVSKASEAERFGVVLQCLQQADKTGMTLKDEAVLAHVLDALREMAQNEEWSEQATSRAIRDANEVAMLLEDEEHGTGRAVRENDPRTRPEVLAVYLELAAVRAWKHQYKKDVDGMVKTYAERMLSNMQAIKDNDGMVKAGMRASTTTPAIRGRQTEILKGVPIYHGLSLAIKILGDDMPFPVLARDVVDHWEEALTTLTEGLKTPETDGGQAVRAWKGCISYR